jgi:hypothetical protein
MHTASERVQMLIDRLNSDDPTLSIVEAVLLRSAFERLDDWLLWLDGHVATDHGADDSAVVVLQMLASVRLKIASELRLVDHVLENIND